MASVAEGATFDWSMPARFGADANGDGLTDYFRSPEQIRPARWRVDFNACALPVGEHSKAYRWYVNNHLVAVARTCQWSWQAPSEGTFRVGLRISSEGTPNYETQQTVTVQDWLIVSFGDSYASGEGVPEVPGASPALLTQFEVTSNSLRAAQKQFELFAANLAEATESKNFFQNLLSQRQAQLNAFLDACTDIDTWLEVQECAAFLINLPFANFQQALQNFTTLVNNARDRFNDAVAAVQAAQNAISETQATIQNLQNTLAALPSGLTAPRWQAPYPNEDWEGDDCHRSANAAPARAARALEDADPRTSVTFVHLACTGAQVDRFRAQLDKQTTWASTLVHGREVDAVLLSIGGNDAGFAAIATACGIQAACYATPLLDPDLGVSTLACTLLGGVVPSFGTACSEFFTAQFDESAAQLVGTGLSALPGKYARVADEMLPRLTGLPSQDRVYITEYVDMTKGSNGDYCTFSTADPLGTLPGFSLPELQWLDQFAASSINDAVANAAAAHGWNAVTGIYEAYSPFGYCGTEHWIVRIYESLLLQGDVKGVAHPNNAGHAFNAQAILRELIADLYPQGLGSAPRAPFSH
jgi:hypothetical protein